MCDSMPRCCKVRTSIFQVADYLGPVPSDETSRTNSFKNRQIKTDAGIPKSEGLDLGHVGDDATSEIQRFCLFRINRLALHKSVSGHRPQSLRIALANGRVAPRYGFRYYHPENDGHGYR